jgi:hypothetical protein
MESVSVSPGGSTAQIRNAARRYTEANSVSERASAQNARDQVQVPFGTRGKGRLPEVA